MFLFYDLIYFFLALFFVPKMIYRGKWHKDMWMRFGFKPLPDGVSKADIWIHAVSVGEVLVISEMLKRLKQYNAKISIVCSTVTKTGQRLAAEQFKGLATVIYAPVDFSWVVKRYIRIINPKVYIAAETEIWPNLYLHLNKTGVPLLQVNGRISDKAFKGYKKISFFLRKVLKSVSLFCVQSETDAKRLETLGADRAKIRIVGNVKFDTMSDTKKVSPSEYGFSDNDRIFIAGSTHPGEEKIVLNVYKELSKKIKSLRLILAPRHIERADEVKQLIERSGLNACKLSQEKSKSKSQEDVLLVDSIGDLRGLYSIGTCVFIGKSLVGKGGQNILEPAYFSKAIFVGPHMENFKEITEMFVEKEAIVVIESEKELLEKLDEYLMDSNKMKKIKVNAGKIMSESKGATDKTVDHILEVLKTA